MKKYVQFKMKLLYGVVIALLFFSAFILWVWALPNPKITPGEADPKLTKEVICSPSFRTGPYRHVTQKMHKDMFKAYGMDWDKDHACCEDDHLISLELGGTNNLANRWPQSWPEAHQKDKVENFLHREVCEGKISLEEAQKEISTDWTKIKEIK